MPITYSHSTVPLIAGWQLSKAGQKHVFLIQKTFLMCSTHRAQCGPSVTLKKSLVRSCISCPLNALSVFGCWMWAEAWKRKRGQIIILCIPPQVLESQGRWCSFVAAAIFFPALFSSGLGVVMDFHCCQVLGASASFVCSLNPAHASILSVLVHVCLVKFLSVCHLLPARS